MLYSISIYLPIFLQSISIRNKDIQYEVLHHRLCHSHGGCSRYPSRTSRWSWSRCPSLQLPQGLQLLPMWRRHWLQEAWRLVFCELSQSILHAIASLGLINWKIIVLNKLSAQSKCANRNIHQRFVARSNKSDESAIHLQRPPTWAMFRKFSYILLSIFTKQ